MRTDVLTLEPVEPRPNPNPPRDFAHPIEAAFARLLDFYRIPWQHEPTTFPLTLNEDGSLAEAFTPDFYLPAEGMYVELTTRRQSLITRKNRKIRLFRNLYPDVRVKLLNRRDLESMLVKYGMHADLERFIGNPGHGAI